MTTRPTHAVRAAKRERIMAIMVAVATRWHDGVTREALEDALLVGDAAARRQLGRDLDWLESHGFLDVIAATERQPRMWIVSLEYKRRTRRASHTRRPG